MYTSAIISMVVGIVFLILNILIFFNEYKYSINVPNENKKGKFFINGIILLSSLGVIIISTIYLFMIYDQLK